MSTTSTLNLDYDTVRANTAPAVLSKIDRTIEERIRFYSTQPIEVIRRRIAELDQEWDIERWLEMNAAGLALTGILFGLAGKKRCLAFSGIVLSFLMLHAVKGWCPPIPALRRLGIRTRKEIDREKYALKAVRGDFRELVTSAESLQTNGAQDLLAAMEKS